MSFDINWNKLDDELAGYVLQFLNRHFQTINKPAFIGDIHVTSFDWGTTAPTVEIIDITDPFPEFYEPEETEDDMDQDTPKKREGNLPVSATNTTPTTTSATPAPTSTSNLSTMSSATGLPLSSSPTNTSDPYFDSLETSIKHHYPDRPTYPWSQQQRIQLMHSFHRSPLVAPQHPFNNTMNPSNRSASYFSPGPTSPTTSSTYFDQRYTTSQGDIQDWIDDEDRRMSSAAAPTSTTNTGTPLVPPSSETLPSQNQQQDPSSTQMDFQSHLLISYKGDMSMTILTELRMNYPSMVFMSLPIQLCVRSVEFEATAVVAYIQSMKRVCVSMLEADDEEIVSIRGKNAVGLESLLRQVQIESVVGDKQKHVLKNVGKIERFIVDQLRKILDDELVFPSYQCVELG
ncbi:uncharacterized protein BX664DRAFT_319321 [Halteromyces radiatus]|uniref:uncharacterized protein n=1 Tax=Halteromyces radiatus TaxID=101107 RepID=UPI00221F4588|nr:uncharacterized protein BX664DRAFT_319321 [Halteromyces radiatus]KAI8098674.1 hypothetical protein BX664DRAFT_319321 [Halteromyces radiatus]